MWDAREFIFERRGRGLEFILIIVIVSVVCLITYGAAIYPTTEKSKETVCFARLRDLGMAMRLYADDWNGCLPSSDSKITYDWQKALMPYIDNLGSFICPSRVDESGLGYGMNWSSTGKQDNCDDASGKIVFADASKVTPERWWVNDDRFVKTKPTRPVLPCHRGRAGFCFLDGHAEIMNPSGTSKENWLY